MDTFRFVLFLYIELASSTFQVTEHARTTANPNKDELIKPMKPKDPAKFTA